MAEHLRLPYWKFGTVAQLVLVGNLPLSEGFSTQPGFLRFPSVLWVSSSSVDPTTSSSIASNNPLGSLERLRIQGEDVSFAGNMGIPTFALRNTNATLFQSPNTITRANNRDTKQIRKRSLEGCLQPRDHSPAFILDNVLTESTCRALIDLMEQSSSFGQFDAGKNHHGAMQILMPQDVVDKVSQTLVPHIDMNLVHERRMEQLKAVMQQNDENVGSLTCMGLNRRWRIYKYAPGGNDRFAPHIDAGFPPSGETVGEGGNYFPELIYDDSQGRSIVSRLTVLLYLNDDFTGGETNFFEPIRSRQEQSPADYGDERESSMDPRLIASIRPVQGSCLVFPQGVGEEAVAYAREYWPLHEGSPVRKGNPKYVIRSDVLFLEEPIPSNQGDDVLFRYDDLVSDAFRPQTSSSIVDPMFLSHVDSLYNPHMGAENLGPLLYSFVRFTKKRRIVEVGAGYTTLYLLKALYDNQQEMERIRDLQTQGKCRLMDWPWASESVVQAYFESSSVDNKRHHSSLLCIDNCLHQKETATGASAVARSLGLDSLLEFVQGDAFDIELSDNSVDLLWCDFGVGPRIHDFVHNLWPGLRPGGFLLCHSTLTNERTRQWLEAARERAPASVTGMPPDEYVELSLLEPHKHYQNSISIFQKRKSYSEPLYSEYA